MSVDLFIMAYSLECRVRGEIKRVGSLFLMARGDDAQHLTI